MKKENFKIIRFTADSKKYYPASTKNTNWLGEEYLKHTEIEIPLGHSRCGGAVIDFPEGVKHPDDLRFVAQLDLTEFSPFDTTGLLPKTGQLLIFSDILTNTGKVIYADVPKEKLVRTIKEHEDSFWDGVLIDNVYPEVESLNERFRKPEDEEDVNGQGLVWDCFAGTEKSKIFGIYTNCQYEQDEIEGITFTDKVLLLQIGEEGFNDEGVFSVLISKEDLKNRIFDHCEFSWGQS